MVCGSNRSRELHHLGKLQVLADQKKRGVAVRLRHPDARHGVSRQAHGGIHRAFAVHPFAHIVEQHRKHHHRRLFHFPPAARYSPPAGS